MYHFAAVYVSLDANAKWAMKWLGTAIIKLQTAHPEGAFTVPSDFNHANLRTSQLITREGTIPCIMSTPMLLKHQAYTLGNLITFLSFYFPNTLPSSNMYCKILSKDCKSVAGRSRLYTIAPVPSHRLEHVCFQGRHGPARTLISTQPCSGPHQQVCWHCHYL